MIALLTSLYLRRGHRAHLPEPSEHRGRKFRRKWAGAATARACGEILEKLHPGPRPQSQSVVAQRSVPGNVLERLVATQSGRGG